MRLGTAVGAAAFSFAVASDLEGFAGAVAGARRGGSGINTGGVSVTRGNEGMVIVGGEVFGVEVGAHAARKSIGRRAIKVFASLFTVSIVNKGMIWIGVCSSLLQLLLLLQFP